MTEQPSIAKAFDEPLLKIANHVRAWLLGEKTIE